MAEALIKSVSSHRIMANISTTQQLPNGQITLNVPRALAQAYGLKKGDRVEFTLIDGKITLEKLPPQEAKVKSKH